jgi:hypothetical protein
MLLADSNNRIYSLRCGDRRCGPLYGEGIIILYELIPSIFMANMGPLKIDSYTPLPFYTPHF